VSRSEQLLTYLPKNWHTINMRWLMPGFQHYVSVQPFGQGNGNGATERQCGHD